MRTKLPFILPSILYLLVSLSTLGQTPVLEWQRCLGGSWGDAAFDAQNTRDGGYILVGWTASRDFDVNGNHGQEDCWVVKTNSVGMIEWQKCYGGSNSDGGWSIQQTSDGGYIIVGSTASSNGDVTINKGSNDGWILKLDGSGNLQWQKTYGGTSGENFRSIVQTSDGGYIVAGSTGSTDGDVQNPHSQGDAWMLKLDKGGNIEWQKCLGGSSWEGLIDVQQTKDGGYIAAGYTSSNDGDVVGMHVNPSTSDAWLIKLSNTGKIEWQKCYGGTLNEFFNSIKQTSDGGYLLGGASTSVDGDVSGNKSKDGFSDCWLVKVDQSGNLQWQNTFGGLEEDEILSVEQDAAGNYLISGYCSAGGEFLNHHGLMDLFVVKLDHAGNFKWQKVLGGSDMEFGYSLLLQNDGGYVVAGFADSPDGDPVGKHDHADFWLLKLSCEPVKASVSITASTNNVCPGTLIDFMAIDSFAGNKPVYQWTINGKNTGQNSATFSSTGLANNDTLICFLTSSHQCVSVPVVASNAIVIKLQQTNPAYLPSVNITSADSLLCKGTAANFRAAIGNTSASYPLRWKINGLETGDTGLVFSSATFKDGDLISAYFLYQSACTSQAITTHSIKMQVDEIPRVQCMSDVSILSGNSIPLTATVQGNRIAKVRWTPETNLANSSSINTFASPMLTTKYTLEATTLNGCKGSDDVLVTVIEKLQAPNSFSPNHDGINDRWVIRGLGTTDQHLVTIFDRFGREIISWKNNYEPWDGTLKGTPLPMGTYYYFIKLAAGEIFKGAVTIIR